MPEETVALTAMAPRQEQPTGMEAPVRRAKSPLSEAGVYTFWRGRVALYAILKSLGIGLGDSVIVPGYTCFAVPATVLFTGARPVYADIERDSFNVSLNTIESAWNTNRNAEIKAILLQHTFGVPVNLNPILVWARARGVATIEDCAHVWGSRYLDSHGEWQEVGLAADAAFYSSQWTKPVSTGLGGWARANNAQLNARLCKFHEEECVKPAGSEVALLAGQLAVRGLFSGSWAQWGIRSIYQWFYQRGLLIGTSTPDELHGKMPTDYAKQMSGFQGKLLEQRLAEESVVTNRRQLKTTYERALTAAGWPVLKIPECADAVLLRYPVRVGNRKQLLAEARHKRIELGDWYSHPIDPPAGLAAERFGYHSGMCPEGERAARETVNLPMHARVSERIALKTVEFLKHAGVPASS